jgi:hypothetical protein
MADNNKDAKELKGILGEINAAMKEMEASNKRVKDGFTSTKDSLFGLVDLATQFNQHQDDSAKLSSDQLKSLSKRFQIEKENLKLSQESLAVQIQRTQDERTASNLEKRRLTILQQTQGHNKERQKQIDKLNKSSNDLTQSISQQQIAYEQANDVLIDIDGNIKNLEKSLEKAAIKAGRFEALNEIGKGLGKVSTPLDGMLNPLNLINKLIGFISGGAIELDKSLGDAAKSMNMTYKAAGESRLEMTRFAKSAGDALVNSTNLQESTLAINESLGSNVAFENMSESFQKDVAFLSKMSHYAGLTADEVNSIAKLTLATNQNAEKFTGELMGQVKISGIQKGIILNEKTALKEISKTSAAIKMSFHGSAKGLGDAYAKAKALGTSLNKVDDIAGSILNFEESIESELSAELLLGKDLNLEKAREAALNNDLATLSDEIAKNVGSAADFSKMNRIQQEAIAKAVGMSREELASSLMEQEALKNIGAASVEDAKAKYDKLRETMTAEEALKALGDEQLAQQFEQQSIQEKIGAAQLTMADSMNETLIPALTTMSEHFDKIFKRVTEIIASLGGMKTIMVVLGAIMIGKLVKGIIDFGAGIGNAIGVARKLFAVQKAEAGVEVVSNSFKMAGPMGPLGIAAVGGLIGAGVAALAMYTMNDGIISPSTGGSGYGSRVLLSPEGAISFNNKDSIVAGTDLFKANDMVSAPQGAVQIASSNNSSKDIADLKSSIMALASRPVNVAIDGKKVIEATTGAQPNTQGLEASKNSYQIQ